MLHHPPPPAACLASRMSLDTAVRLVALHQLRRALLPPGTGIDPRHLEAARSVCQAEDRRTAGIDAQASPLRSRAS